MTRATYPIPALRRLRVYAFDPQASTRVETARVNVAIISLPWEAEDELGEYLEPGPVNTYLEVVDFDPVSEQFYEPVDLNNSFLLAQDGLAPSEGDPRFHQQMVFAVAMKTIKAFERALGRTVFWSPRRNPETGIFERVDRLRVYPHALREANAYYSPTQKALLFGYFKSSTLHAGASWVFTALSHDVIAHETTHAIVDGMHRHYIEPTSEDSLAFHEAFADIVALMSHFTLSEAVHDAISVHGGNLDERTLMSGLARQFGAAIGRPGALREAIDVDMGGTPDPTALDRITEPHARGAVLVSAVFDAFLTIYRRRTADLLRIANISIDKGARRELHPDLTARLTREAVKAADHVLRMCIRALDYLPPVDVRFGEFLRALVTADADLVPDDPFGYRLAMVEAFRSRGIVPENCLSLAVDSLLWERPEDVLKLDAIPGLQLDPVFDRVGAAQRAAENVEAVEKWFFQSEDQGKDDYDDDDGETEGKGEDSKDLCWQKACGVIFREDLMPEKGPLKSILFNCDKSGRLIRKLPPAEIQQVRTTRRAGPDGQDIRQLIIEVTQERRGFFDPVVQKDQDLGRKPYLPGDFIFRGGATMIFDLRSKKLRYVIRKRIDDEARLAAHRAFLAAHRRGGLLGATYGSGAFLEEPFAMLHRGV
ncbi:hypothetical protein V5G24_06055 [Xanthobacter sp. VTT E-85241]|uniref:hypothetical protein n=1 Tax=Roseixanthobacter finlandensis TaxID=3119922 RepID=UPI003726AFAF